MSTYQNFVKTKTTTALTNGGTSVNIVVNGATSKLPLDGGGTLILTDSMNDPHKVEIITYTGFDGTTLSGLTRGAEGTTAQSWPIDSFCYQALTAADYKATVDAVANKLDKSGGTLTGSLVLAAAPTADMQAVNKKYIDDSLKSVGASIGDILHTTSVPDSTYIPCNTVYSKTAYPELATKLGNLINSNVLGPYISVPANITFNSAAFGNNIFVVMPSSGTSYVTSSDGVNWTIRTLPVACNTVAFNGSVFLAATGSNQANNSYCVSSDGINWSTYTFPSGMASGQRPTAANGKFFVINSSTTSGFVSTDGISWTQFTVPIASQYTTVCYGNGIYIAVGPSGNYLTSSDGVSWTARINVPNGISSLAFGAGKFIGTNPFNKILSSTDGISWEIYQPFPDSSVGTASMVYTGEFFIFSPGTGPNYPRVYISKDALNWTSRYLKLPALSASMAYGNDLIIIPHSAPIAGSPGTSFISRMSIYTYNTATEFISPASVGYLQNPEIKAYIKAKL